MFFLECLARKPHNKGQTEKFEREPEQCFPTTEICRKLAPPFDCTAVKSHDVFKAEAYQTTNEPSVLSLMQTFKLYSPTAIPRKELGLLGYHAEDLRTEKNNICNTVRNHSRHCECLLFQLLWGHFATLGEQTLVTGGMFLRDGDGCPEHCRTSKTCTSSCVPSCTSH